MKTKLMIAFLALAATSFSYALEKGDKVKDKGSMMDKGEKVKMDKEKAPAMDKSEKVKVDKEKGTITREVNKKGDWQVGAGKVEPRPDHIRTEADKRRDQQNSEGKVFLQKTFP